jgi:hypothetical protein
MWWAYTWGGLYSGGLIVGGLRYTKSLVSNTLFKVSVLATSSRFFYQEVLLSNWMRS